MRCRFLLANHPGPTVLDEVQYAPEVMAALKRRVDLAGDQSGQYILTGSQQWQVMRVLAESLAGRAVFIDLHGLSLAEYADSPDALRLAEWLTELTRLTLKDDDLRPSIWPMKSTTSQPRSQQKELPPCPNSSIRCC